VGKADFNSPVNIEEISFKLVFKHRIKRKKCLYVVFIALSELFSRVARNTPLIRILLFSLSSRDQIKFHVAHKQTNIFNVIYII
jgi:hypothetical protein